MTTETTVAKLIELSTPRGDRGVYVCRECYTRLLTGEIDPIRQADTGAEYCQVFRGESNVYSTCDCPSHR